MPLSSTSSCLSASASTVIDRRSTAGRNAPGPKGRLDRSAQFFFSMSNDGCGGEVDCAPRLTGAIHVTAPQHGRRTRDLGVAALGRHQGKQENGSSTWGN